MDKNDRTPFCEEAERWIRKAAEDASGNYIFYRNVHACEEAFPFMQKMSILSRHKILSIDSKWGRECFGEEYCYYVICEALDGQMLEYYLKLLDDLAERDVRREDPAHEYTFVSLVIVTTEFFDRKMRRRVKRYRGMSRYREKDKEYGWSAKRICVVDLETMQLCWSVMGEPLGRRLMRR